MSKISAKTTAFLQTMSPRQWAMLAALVEGPHCLGISDRVDPDVSALIGHGLATVYHFETEFERLPILYPSDIAEHVVNARNAGIVA